jgi:hypothetical protein
VQSTARKTYGQTVKRLHRAGGLDRDVLEGIEELTEIREDVRRIAAVHGAGDVRMFGSVGRGEQSASSDLDLLVDMAEGRTLFDRALGSRWMSSPRPACRPTCATAFSMRRLRSEGH